MAPSRGVNRRHFVQAAASAPFVFHAVPRHVLGGRGRVAPSDTLHLACIGMGFQGLRMLPGLLRRPDVRVMAVCDPNTESNDYIGWGRARGGKSFAGGREVGRRAVEAHYGRGKRSGTHKGCGAYADFRELLEKEKDLDAVHIITPDHLHATIAIAAMCKGKHAATHKPISNIMYETRLAVETALAAAGLPMPAKRPLDGKDMTPALKGRVRTLHDHLFWSSGGWEGKWAVRSGKWKLVGQKDRVELFDLAADVGETTDLSRSRPEKVAELRKLHNAWLDRMAEPLSGAPKRWSPAAEADAAARRKKKAQRKRDRGVAGRKRSRD